MMDQISSYLHGLGIKLNTTQPIIVYNSIKMRIMIKLSLEESQFQVLFILSLVLLSSGKYRFNQIYPLTPLIYKLDACTMLSIKIRLSVDTCKPYPSILVKQQYIGKTTQAVFLLLEIK